jgi:hypothetical protein
MQKVTEVRALDGFRLQVEFSDGVSGVIDLSHLVGHGVFALWNDPARFQAVYVGDGGQISWSDSVDICPDAVYLQITGKKAEEIFPRLKAAVDA